MGYPLVDITIYYEGAILEVPPVSWVFRNKLNFIADYYHDRLNGYKPPKTGRICVRFLDNGDIEKSSYFGSICSCSVNIDATLYLNLNEEHRNKYILDLLHDAVMDLAATHNWDKKRFKDSYDYIIEHNFVFRKYYPDKKSRSGKYSARVMIEKTEAHSILFVFVTGDKEVGKIIVRKKNWWWWDSLYTIARQFKWLDGDSFGINKNGKLCYLSVSNEEIVNNIVFKSSDF